MTPLGGLTQVQNTPAGKGCTTRIYAYDEDSNRVSLTTREPNLKKECTTHGRHDRKATPTTPPTGSPTPASPTTPSGTSPPSPKPTPKAAR